MTALPATDERVLLDIVGCAHRQILAPSLNHLDGCSPESVISNKAARQYIDTLVDTHGSWIVSEPHCGDLEKKKFVADYLKKRYTALRNNPPTVAIDFYRQVVRVSWEWKFTLFSLCQLQLVQGGFYLTPSDFKILGKQDFVGHTNPTVTCLAWAMYQQHMQQLFEPILDLSEWPEKLLSSPQTYLPSIGFTEVAEPRTGDLIVYYSSQISSSEHFGVIADDMQVYSKWGETQIFKHPVTTVPTYYGDCYFFFRKEWPSKTLQTWVETKKVIPLPLTAYGAKTYLLKQLISHLFQAKVLERSIFGKPYHTKLAYHLGREAQKPSYEGSAEKQVEAMARNANASVLPDFEMLHF